jgi:hypothetical protein
MRVVPGLRFVIAAGLALFLGGGLLVAGPAPSAEAAGNRSGMPWKSGSYQPTGDPTAQNAFGRWRRARTDVALVYGARQNWEVIENPSWIFDAWRNAHQTVVISAAPWPETGGSLLACSRGDYDAHWSRFGRNVTRAGMAGRVVVRLAWEFNGNWNPWAATNPTRFVYCWRHLQAAAESTARALRWEWCVNRGVGDVVLTDAAQAYPGDRYVDFVGMSSYDGYPAVKDAASWRTQYAGPGGLKHWADFARRRHKKLALSEWGLFPGTAWGTNGGGDNPRYVSRMFDFFRQQRSIMGYEAYFNEDDPYQAGALSLNPKGAAEYRRQVARARRL